MRPTLWNVCKNFDDDFQSYHICTVSQTECIQIFIRNNLVTKLLGQKWLNTSTRHACTGKNYFFRKYYSPNIFSSLVWAVLHEYLPGCLRRRATVSSHHQMKRANAVFWVAGFSVPCKERLFSRIFGQFHIQHICCMALSHCFCAAAFVGFEKSGIFISLRRFTFMESRKKDRF